MAVRSPGRIVAVAIALVLTTACAGPGITPGPTQASLAPASTTNVTPAPPTPPPTSFSSAVLPYSVVLPAGWVELSNSGEEEIYESADLQWTLAVGTGHPEPGQAVEDRVRINRESEFASCDTDPETDRAVTVDGERGIVWAFACGTISGLAANGIHDGVGYRLTLRNYGNAADQLEAVMAGILAGFAFTE
jgi:hypothetical protein